MAIPVHAGTLETQGEPGVAHRGPALLGLAVIAAMLFVTSTVMVGVLAEGGLESPYEDMDAGFFVENDTALQWNAFLQIGGAIVLGLFAATAVSRLRFLGVRAAGAHIALVGGIAGAVFVAIAALVMWVLTQLDPVGSSDVAEALHLFLFATGGIGYVAAVGLLMAGVSIAAGVHGLVPRWVTVLGIALAVLCELATLSLIVPVAVYLVPLARLGSFVWMICLGATLPTVRARAATPVPVISQGVEQR